MGKIVLNENSKAERQKKWDCISLEAAGIEIIDGDRGINYPKNEDFYINDYCLFLSTKNVPGFGFDFKDCSFISKEKDIELRKGKLQRGDIVLTTRGTVGNVALFGNDVLFDHIRINSGMVILRNSKKTVSTDFLYMMLKSEYVRAQFLSLASGSAQPQLPIKDLRQVVIPIPSFDEQEYITKVFFDFDDKIELNNRMNKTLENIAQAIFKHWFIDFEFPTKLNDGKFNILSKDGKIDEKVLGSIMKSPGYRSSGGKLIDSEIGEIPEGWKVIRIDEFIEVKDGTHESPKQQQEGKKLITSKHLKENYIDFSDAYFISENDFDDINKRSQVHRNDILITMIGTVGNFYFVSDESIDFVIKNIGLYKSSQRLDLAYYLYVYLRSDCVKDFYSKRLAGSTQQYLTLSTLRETPIMFSDLLIFKIFNDLNKCIIKLISNNQSENRNLFRLRDSILPRLMSDKIEALNVNKR